MSENTEECAEQCYDSRSDLKCKMHQKLNIFYTRSFWFFAKRHFLCFVTQTRTRTHGTWCCSI